MKSPNSQLENLMSELSHKIRTPLSIIQNELTCIKPKLTEEEYQTLITACRNINKILKEPISGILPQGVPEKNE